jgi:hypothetical protein
MEAANNSPVSSQYESVRNNQHYYNVTSPSNSDGNHYQSPIVSPGYWNDSSPSSTYNNVSPRSNASFQGSPNSSTSEEIRSSPPSTPPPSFQAPALPNKLGNQNVLEVSRNSSREYGKVFRQAFGKKDVEAYLVPNGTEAFATSSRKKKEPMVMEDLYGSVNDFKCGFDLDREKAAKKHALRIITRLDNAA